MRSSQASPASRSPTGRRSSMRLPRQPERRFRRRFPSPMPRALPRAMMLGSTLLLLAATAKELCGSALRWVAVLLFVGSVGLWDRVHQLSPELGLLLGVTAGLYGFALALRRPALGGAIAGAGVAVAFLSQGLLGPLWLGLTAIALPAAFPTWRTRAHAVTRSRGARGSPSTCLCVAGGARRARARPLGRMVGGAEGGRAFPVVDLGRLAVPGEEPALVRVAGAAPRALDAVDARARIQWRARDAVDPAAGYAGAVDGRDHRAHRRAPRDHPDADAPALVAHRGAGNRLAATQPFRLPRLVRHPDLRPGRGAAVVALVRCLRARDVGDGRAVCPRHRNRLSADRSSGSPSPCRSCSRFSGWRWFALHAARIAGRSSTGPLE